MKYSYAILGMVLFGMFGLVFIVMFESITINNESEYYVLKEAMEAAMLESVDIACYMLPEINSLDSGGTPFNKNGCGGKIKISEQRFVENFTKRFGASINGDVRNYTLDFYDIMESPPKATVVVKGKTQTYKLSISDTDSEFDIVNNLTGILEFNNQDTSSTAS